MSIITQPWAQIASTPGGTMHHVTSDGANTVYLVNRINEIFSIDIKADPRQWIRHYSSSTDRTPPASFSRGPTGIFYRTMAANSYPECTTSPSSKFGFLFNSTPRMVGFLQLKDQSFVGIDPDCALWTRIDKNAGWVKASFASYSPLRQIIELSDGTFIGVGQSDSVIYRYNSRVAAWEALSDLGPVTSITQCGDQIVIVRDNALFSAPAKLASAPVATSESSLGIKLNPFEAKEVDDDIVMTGSYDVRYTATEVALNMGYQANLTVEVSPEARSGLQLALRQATRPLGLVKPNQGATVNYPFSVKIRKDELVHGLHSCNAFNDPRMALTATIKLKADLQMTTESTLQSTVVLQ